MAANDRWGFNSAFKGLKVFPEKSQILSCDPFVANGPHVLANIDTCIPVKNSRTEV